MEPRDRRSLSLVFIVSRRHPGYGPSSMRVPHVVTSDAPSSPIAIISPDQLLPMLAWSRLKDAGMSSPPASPEATGISTPATATTVDFSSICKRGPLMMASSLQRAPIWPRAVTKFWSRLAFAMATESTQPEATLPGRCVDGSVQ
jgi:hypothetical protein